MNWPGQDSDPATAPVSRRSAASTVRAATNDARRESVDQGRTNGRRAPVAPMSSITSATSTLSRPG
jgi:hypothetical protein